MRVNVISQSLSHINMNTYFARKSIIPFRITVRFVYPELISEDSVQVESAGKRFRRESFSYVNTPGHIVLFQCHCHFCLFRRIFRDESEQYICFPLIPFSVIPPCTEGEQSHVSGILDFSMSRDNPFPVFAEAMYPIVITGSLYSFGYNG